MPEIKNMQIHRVNELNAKIFTSLLKLSMKKNALRCLKEAHVINFYIIETMNDYLSNE